MLKNTISKIRLWRANKYAKKKLAKLPVYVNSIKADEMSKYNDERTEIYKVSSISDFLTGKVPNLEELAEQKNRALIEHMK